MRWPPCVASSLDHEVDLNGRPKRQRGHRDRRAGGKGLTEILCVDAIHRDEVTHARQIHTGAHDIVETLAGRLENCREVLEDALRLGHNSPLDHLASGWVLSDLSAEVEETTGGASSGEVIAVLLMANSCRYWSIWSGWWKPEVERAHSLRRHSWPDPGSL